MKIISHPKSLEFSAPGHPECPERIESALKFLEGQYEILRPEPATEAELLKIHTLEHLSQIRELDFYEPDCPRYPNIYEYSALAAGGAILASAVEGFSLMRPPGHHASGKSPAGFCYFNNIAVAVKASGKKTLIIDIDGHHGDGTEAIFIGDPQVIFVSLHSYPNYPGTGLSSIQNCFNLPLPLHCGDEIYLKTLDEILKRISLKNIEQIAVSAGFDTFYLDPLASLGLTTECYFEIGKRIARLNIPTFSVLEGGYVVEHLGPNIHSYLQGLLAGR